MESRTRSVCLVFIRSDTNSPDPCWRASWLLRVICWFETLCVVAKCRDLAFVRIIFHEFGHEIARLGLGFQLDADIWTAASGRKPEVASVGCLLINGLFSLWLSPLKVGSLGKRKGEFDLQPAFPAIVKLLNLNNLRLVSLDNLLTDDWDIWQLQCWRLGCCVTAGRVGSLSYICSTVVRALLRSLIQYKISTHHRLALRSYLRRRSVACS